MQDVITSMHYRGVQTLDVNIDNCILSQLNSFYNGYENVYVYNNIYVVADTYITNKESIKEKINTLGYKLTSNLNEELIAILYKEFNKGFVEFIEGAFAIIIYDAKTKKMYIVRDRIGEKTLYYAGIPGGVVCTTELKTILKQLNTGIGLVKIFIILIRMKQTMNKVIKEDLKKYCIHRRTKTIILWGIHDTETPLKNGYDFYYLFENSRMV